MLTRSELDQLADLCRTIADESSDDYGFVSVRSLLARFRATLHVRPLLVEGMLASVEQKSETATGETRWAVLIDSETFQVHQDQIDSENRYAPLPSRLRNTVAHELVHSLAFRPNEFGVQLKLGSKEKGDAEKLVKKIELETEKLSPLLLWSRKAIAKLIKGRKDQLTIDELVRVAKEMGVSRAVLVNRLCLLRPTDADRPLYSDALRNISVGIGEWALDGTAVIRGWPIFMNFDGNITPSFLLRIGRQDRLPATTFCNNPAFYMCGGSNRVVELLVNAGTEVVPAKTKMNVEIAVEDVSKRPGAEFVFVVRRLS